MTNNSLPYLKVFYPGDVRAISGSTPAAGSTVNLAVNGVILNATSYDNGFYYYLAGENIISGIDTRIADGTPILFYLNGGATVGNTIVLAPSSNGSIANTAILANTLTIGGNTASTISNVNLATALGGLSGSQYLYSTSGNNLILGNSTSRNVAFSTTANTTYHLNGNISPISGSTNSSITFNGSVIANNNISLMAAAIYFMNALSGSGNINLTGANSNNSLTMNASAPQVFNITGKNSGNISSIAGYIGALIFTNIQNLIGGANGNTFNFSNGATMSGTINGVNLNGANTINIGGYNTALKINLSSTNNGVIHNMNNSTITSFANIANVNMNPAFNNTIIVPSSKASTLSITGGGKGYINDPLFFSGVNTFISTNGGTVKFTTNAAYNPAASTYYVNGVGMSFTGFAAYSGFTIASPTIDVSNIMQQPPANAEQNTATPVSVSPIWTLTGTAVSKNIAAIMTDVSHQMSGNPTVLEINSSYYVVQ